MLVGGHETLQPSVEFLGSSGAFSYYLSGSYLTNTLGIENPTPSRDAIHDRTQQSKGFAYFSYIPNDTTRLATMLGTYVGKFQIPNNPDQSCAFSLTGVCDVGAGTNNLPSSQLDQNQRESNHYAVLALQQHYDKLDYQAALFAQSSKLHYSPDPSGGDLIYLGVASDAERTSRSVGLQADAAYRHDRAHTIRFGALFSWQRTASDNTVGVFPTDDAGNQISDIPLTIVDTSSKTGNYSSLYLQDEWRIMPAWTVNYGIRYDRVNAFVDEQQWSPRLNTLWKVTEATSVHAAYARYFTPPPQELVSQRSIDLYANTTNAPEIPVSDTAKSERTHYFDVGLTQTVATNWIVGVDAYYKHVKNLLDEGQFGQALILTPFNYARGYAEGVELSTTYTGSLWSAYANFAIARAKGKDIVTAQSLFGADELAYISDHYIYLDHDQRYSLSTGATRRFGPTALNIDVLCGSGLRNTPDDAPPNSGKLPSYTQVNLALTHQWPKTAFGTLEGRLALVNAFDRSYLLRDGTGVGVGAPQYAERRTLYGGLTLRF
jgi:outer membrane receptor protein involved in Fe transport